MRTVAERARRRLGRRGLYLLAAGAGWGLYGVGILLDPRPGTVRSAAVLRHLLPLEVWGWGWVLCAAVAAVTAFSRCPVRRAWGFSAATMPPLLWSLAFAAAWVTGEYPGAWAGAATWAGAAARLAIAAGWPEPTPLPAVVVRRE